jgi:adenine-specific DNA-methyltransferase
MKIINSGEEITKTLDLVSEKIQKLKKLFPEAVTDGKLDITVLKELLGFVVEDEEEKYKLNWYGKRQSRQLALTPSTGTLRPVIGEGFNEEVTNNLIFEGDNLEILKLLQKSYNGSVKFIYIDPPYNTGNEFVYCDNYQDNIKNYLQFTGQLGDEGKTISTNTESSGRFHTAWLNMMYPRLKVAANLLHPEGIIFISIDDGEIANLRKICDEIFGEENYIQQIVWKRHAGGGNDSKYFATDHEYIVAYAKNKAAISRLRMPLSEEDKAEYKLTDKYVDTLGPYKLKSFLRMREDDPRPGLTYDITTPDGTILHETWKWEQQKFLHSLKDEKVQIRKDRNGKWQVEYKIYLNSKDEDSEDEFEERTKVPRSLLLDVERNSDGKRQLRETFGEENVFNNPKPLGLIQHLMTFGAGSNDIVLDFFAGSGSTGHAVMLQNLLDGGSRRFILVQLPEPLDPKNKAQKVSALYCDKIGKPRNLAEITKQRIRQAAKIIHEKNPEYKGDLGFRVFKLDTSNIKTWEPNRQNIIKSIAESVEHIKTDRSDMDVIYELLLKTGLDLTSDVEIRTFVEKEIASISKGLLMVCLAKQISQNEVELISNGIIKWHKELGKPSETTCIFRDNAFADDVAKTNLAEILQQNGIKNVRSL